MKGVVQVGIPNSILHFENRGIFQHFLECLGIPVMLSPATNRSIFQLGKQRIIDEFCFPLKVYAGHVVHLALQNVKPIFIPIICGSVSNHSFPCHAQIRLYDIIRDLNILEADSILTGVFTYDGSGFKNDGFFEVGRKLGFHDTQIGNALEDAKWIARRAHPRRTDSGKTNIGILGHSYVLQDPWVNMGIIQKLIQRGCTVVTEEDCLPEGFFPEDINLHFTMSARTFQAFKEMNANRSIQGMVFLLPFNCGPDADIVDRLIHEAQKPFLVLVIDELTSDGGMLTRLEAFLDGIALASCADRVHA
jgi:predicted nucleotide-binding protein (sugar kinase/HSP70/actin superfamily)